MVHNNDAVLVISNSGESEEIVRLLKPLKRMAASVVAITGNKASALAKHADESIVYRAVAESLFNLAPSTSAVVAMSIGHALALALCDRREFTDAEFARYHPAGSLGFKLSSVNDHMRRGAELRIARASASVREVFAQARHQGRRTGAVMLVDDDGVLKGLFTDSDLARLFEHRADHCFDDPVSAVMTKTPLTVRQNARMVEAVAIMRDRKISELPVIDADGRPIGLLDITDLIGADARADGRAGIAQCANVESRQRLRPNMANVSPDRFAAVELLVLDVDGVLTDGRITYTDGGEEIKSFHVRDGTGLKFWKRSGKRVAILTGRSSPIVNRRAAELGIDYVVQGADEKLAAFRHILSEIGLHDQACAVGDDLPDLPVLAYSGIAVAVADAVAELKEIAAHVTAARGGHGAVREAIEWLMRGQGTWPAGA